jgi:hypothetical protein
MACHKSKKDKNNNNNNKSGPGPGHPGFRFARLPGQTLPLQGGPGPGYLGSTNVPPPPHQQTTTTFSKTKVLLDASCCLHWCQPRRDRRGPPAGPVGTRCQPGLAEVPAGPAGGPRRWSSPVPPEVPARAGVDTSVNSRKPRWQDHRPADFRQDHGQKHRVPARGRMAV